jgi:hypothetical protein
MDAGPAVPRVATILASGPRLNVGGGRTPTGATALMSSGTIPGRRGFVMRTAGEPRNTVGLAGLKPASEIWTASTRSGRRSRWETALFATTCAMAEW